MEVTIDRLPRSRVKIHATLDETDLGPFLTAARAELGRQVTVRGFRPGKAPDSLVAQKAGSGRLLSKLVDHALAESLAAAAQEHDLTVIESPKYSLEKLCEITADGALKTGTTMRYVAEADVAPAVIVGDYHRLGVTPAPLIAVTDETVNAVLKELAQSRAIFVPVTRESRLGDQVEIDFQGKLNGIPEKRLASQHYPIIIGRGVMIPSFEDHLVRRRAGDNFSFEATFPKNYHTPDLAGQKVIFDVSVHSVAASQIPPIDDSLARDLGRANLDQLKKSLRDEQTLMFAQRAKEANEAATLEAFLKLVQVDVPASLVERELDRQVKVMREQATRYGLLFDDYLRHLKKTPVTLRQELQPSAEKGVKIGLGLSEVVKRENITDQQHAGQKAVERLMNLALNNGQ